ncbi:hypothetical protein EIP91_000143 [Steccherinum ochraceum]|uniref:Uncharacterized protein n=1 Tax=Steccherinum ochraceum TaxID=92696 RepID=A0A4R0RQK9_9APHY|nr:hypothetical protein EIP91_000143 [Steccherinum ochraceum]
MAQQAHMPNGPEAGPSRPRTQLPPADNHVPQAGPSYHQYNGLHPTQSAPDTDPTGERTAVRPNGRARPALTTERLRHDLSRIYKDLDRIKESTKAQMLAIQKVHDDYCIPPPPRTDSQPANSHSSLVPGELYARIHLNDACEKLFRDRPSDVFRHFQASRAVRGTTNDPNVVHGFKDPNHFYTVTICRVPPRKENAAQLGQVPVSHTNDVSVLPESVPAAGAAQDVATSANSSTPQVSGTPVPSALGGLDVNPVSSDAAEPTSQDAFVHDLAEWESEYGFISPLHAASFIDFINSASPQELQFASAQFEDAPAAGVAPQTDERADLTYDALASYSWSQASQDATAAPSPAPTQSLRSGTPQPVPSAQPSRAATPHQTSQHHLSAAPSPATIDPQRLHAHYVPGGASNASGHRPGAASARASSPRPPTPAEKLTVHEPRPMRGRQIERTPASSRRRPSYTSATPFQNPTPSPSITPGSSQAVTPYTVLSSLGGMHSLSGDSNVANISKLSKSKSREPTPAPVAPPMGSLLPSANIQTRRLGGRSSNGQLAPVIVPRTSYQNTQPSIISPLRNVMTMDSDSSDETVLSEVVYQDYEQPVASTSTQTQPRSAPGHSRAGSASMHGLQLTGTTESTPSPRTPAYSQFSEAAPFMPTPHPLHPLSSTLAVAALPDVPLQSPNTPGPIALPSLPVSPTPQKRTKKRKREESKQPEASGSGGGGEALKRQKKESTRLEKVMESLMGEWNPKKPPDHPPPGAGGMQGSGVVL